MSNASNMRDRLIGEFTENYMEKLFYFCLKKTGSNSEAEDLTQDIAMNIIAAINKGTIPTNFSPWVWQIARNRYSVWADEKHRRNESVTGFDIGEYEIEDDSVTTLDEMIRSEQLSLLRRELAFISSDYRNIVVAYYIENRSMRDIADSLSLSLETVKKRLQRARSLLKEGMKMAREFGKRSYRPEQIGYTNVCINPGELGQPWTLMDPKLNQNIFLLCYDNPMSAMELAIEAGVALPYMEDTLSHLSDQTLLAVNGMKYETAFPIISREAQQKIHFYFKDIMPRLIPMIEENIDRLMLQYEEAELCFYGRYQNYEEAKWALLMFFYKELYALCENSPINKLGNTRRPNKGQWDVIGFAKNDFLPKRVGYHCQTHDFVHYRYEYAEIWSKTPANLAKDETHILRCMVDGKSFTEVTIADRLVSYGYACKDNDIYIPRVAIISKTVNKKFLKFRKDKRFSENFRKHEDARRKLNDTILNMIAESNKTVRSILFDDLPESIRCDGKIVDALLESISTSHALGYVLEQALSDGWLKYDENITPAVGAYFNLP